MRMTEEQFVALLEFVDCKIEEKITGAFGRDTLSETRMRLMAEDDLRKKFMPEIYGR